MTREKIQKALEDLTQDIAKIAAPKVVTTLNTLLNLVEVLAQENETLRQNQQALKDEVNRLKGEQGKPEFSKGKDNKNADHSSESQRKKRKKKEAKKSKKKKEIKIDKRVPCNIDKNSLPNDAIFKGYEKVVMQDIVILTNNIEFIRATYYSPSQNKTFLGELPAEYTGQFGPGIRSLVLDLCRHSNMTQSAITQFFNTFRIDISKATVSRMLTEGHDVFHQEKEAIIKAGLKSTDYQNLDDTGAKVNGTNQYTHVLCNPYYTAFFTLPKKDRLTILSFLCFGQLQFTIGEQSYELMTELGLPEKHIIKVKTLSAPGIITREQIDELLKELFPNPKKQRTNRRRLLEACAIVYYRHSEYAIDYLMCDDAPQFNKIAKYKALCWIHEGRHYKKLRPIVPAHRDLLDEMIEKFWDFYQELKDYKEHPSLALAQALSEKFDALFSTKTGYEALDERLAMTLEKKKALLLVLIYPFLPLHNNPAELGARVQARIRDINLHTISEKGTQAKDTFATIVQTAIKLGVNVYDYIYDRITKKFEMPSLADLISERSGTIPNTS